MLVSIQDWVFDVDISQNMQISSQQAADHCMCGYCRNFYQTVDNTYPSLRAFLAQFGAHIEGPDELSPFEPTIYEASYIIHGRVLLKGRQQLLSDGIPIVILDEKQADMDTERPTPYFVLLVGLMELPWMLQEDPLEVVSPANEPSYMARMEKKLLARMTDEHFYC